MVGRHPSEARGEPARRPGQETIHFGAAGVASSHEVKLRVRQAFASCHAMSGGPEVEPAVDQDTRNPARCAAFPSSSSSSSHAACEK